LIVLGADNGASSRIGADHISRRAKAADMVPAILRIVFNAKEARLGPETAMAEGVGDAAKCKVVVGHLGCWRRPACTGAACMVVGQADDAKLREGAGIFKLVKFLDESVGPHHIRNSEVPANRVCGHKRAQRFDPWPAANLYLTELLNEIVIEFQVGGPGLFSRIFPTGLWKSEFAVVPQRLAVLDGIVPNKTRRRIGQRIYFIIAHAVRIAPRESGERALDILVGHGAIGPLMAVGAQNPATVSIVEQNKLAHQLVEVRRDMLSKHAERRIAIPLTYITQDLIVAPVFFDDINDVFED